LRAFSADDPRGPRAVFEQTSFDFGEVAEGERVVRTFVVRNTGTEDLRLDPIVVGAVKASCALPNSLTVSVPSFSDADTVVIKPGQSNEIVATLETDGFAVPAFDGRFYQTTRVFSNDPAAPRTVLHINGRIKPLIVRDPGDVQLGAVFKAHGELPVELPPVRLRAAAGNLFSVTRVESSVPFLKPVATLAPDGRDFVVTARIDPAIPDGPLVDVHLTVYTNHPEKPKFTIPVSGYVYPERPITATPGALRFGFVRPGGPVSAVVTLERAGSANWKVLGTKVTAQGASVRTAVRPIASGFELAVSLQAPSRPWAGFSGEIEVATDSKQQPKFVLPFAGWTYDDAPMSTSDAQLKAFVGDTLGSELLQDSDEVLTRALSAGKDSRAWALLLALTSEGTVQGRINALLLLRRLDPIKAAEAYEAIVRSDNEELVRDEALTGFFELARTRSLPLLVDSLDDPGQWIREQAATLLGELGDPRAKEALLRATRDKVPDVALAAVEALEQFFEEAPKR
jgi:hypothetical protein